MSNNKNKYPEWVLRYKKKGTAINKVGSSYYLYKVKSKWDKELKRARKITEEYLGVIRPEGVVKPVASKNIPNSVKEYGAYNFIKEITKEDRGALEVHFGKWWKEIYIISIFRFFYKSALKHIRVHYEDSFISEEIMGARLNNRGIHNLLVEVGADREKVVDFLKGYKGGGAVLIDLTHIFSNSEGVGISGIGYNSDFDFTPQVNLLFLFSMEKDMPIFYRVLPGNVRDVKTMKLTIEEAGIKDGIIISDKGFYSEENLEILERENLLYIIPLKRGSGVIDYERIKVEGYERYFRYGERFIWYKEYEIGGRKIYIYLDERLRVMEEEDYLNRIEANPEEGYSIDYFKGKRERFGTIGLISNLKGKTGEEIYSYYKSRHKIEVMFDAFKNLLCADRTYMRGDKEMECWMFINFLSIVYYYKVYKKLLQNNLLKKYTPQDLIFYLSKVRKAKIRNKWITLEIPKQARVIYEKLKIPIT